MVSLMERTEHVLGTQYRVGFAIAKTVLGVQHWRQGGSTETAANLKLDGQGFVH